MKRDYLTEKELNKKSTKEGIWILFVFILLFIFVIFRIAIRSGTNDRLFGSLPTKNDAFQIAKDYLRPNFKTQDIEFNDDDFQCSKNADSIYVVKSYFKTLLAGSANPQTKFIITLKYNGGENNRDRNWTVMKLIEN
ncbi:hypothetical protein [Mucilaginibacter sp.]|uniref:hypothetical protein n=1 Tax=Mucilaginibacter sp. TaxID=1882438 RepID=UPI003D0A6B81